MRKPIFDIIKINSDDGNFFEWIVHTSELAGNILKIKTKQQTVKRMSAVQLLQLWMMLQGQLASPGDQLGFCVQI